MHFQTLVWLYLNDHCRHVRVRVSITTYLMKSIDSNSILAVLTCMHFTYLIYFYVRGNYRKIVPKTSMKKRLQEKRLTKIDSSYFFGQRRKIIFLLINTIFYCLYYILCV